MKLLLVWPGARHEVLGWGDLGAIAEPLALEYLATAAKLDGHEVRVLDLRLHPGQLDPVLCEFAPDVVGVTAYSMHVLTALAICRRVKQHWPACHTMAGGHHATLLPEDFFDPAVDFVVVGEGIGPLRALLHDLSRQAGVTAIPGVWRQSGGTFISGGNPLPFRIDDLPLPDRSITAADRHAYYIDWMRPLALVRTSVGCPYRCTFCSLWKIMDGRYIQRSVAPVIEELRTIAEEFVFLVDDEAFINGRRMLKLAEAIKAAAVHKRYFAYCRVDTLVREREAIVAWRAIGLERLFIGIDAISEEDLAAYNKKVAVAEIETALALAKELGISVFAQFVVNPNFDRQDFKRVVRFIEHHRIDYPSFTILTPIPGTALLSTFDHITEQQPNGRPNWDLFDCQNTVVKTRLPKQDFLREYWNLYRVFRGNYLRHKERPSSTLGVDGLEGGAGSRLTAPGAPDSDAAKGQRA